jgi:UDP-N-acetylmuramoylalanine--D-glutamate ligase
MKYVVYGLGKSGLSAINFLAKNGEEVVATDDNQKAIFDAKTAFEKTATAANSKVIFSAPDEITYDADTVISFAPGIPLYFPKPHKILETVKETAANLACDIEIFYRKNLQNNFIAITGTNGKSTTTALSGFVFEQLEIKSAIGGNIGTPCFELPQNQQNFSYIFETSSYQLDLLSQTHFGIAALLNITPDHIDRHGSMTGYIEAKKRVFRNQVVGDFALIDADNENSKSIFLELQNDKNFHATLVPISTNKVLENGVALIDGKLTCKISGNNFSTELKSEFLRGKHNEQNMAFAFAIAYCHTLQQNLEIAPEKIIEAIKKFRGLRHRMQIVGDIGNVKFINDSKATNAESSEHALKAYDNIFWILGGKAKEGGISNLAPLFSKVAKAYLIGEASEEFAKVLEKNSVKFEKCGDLKAAFARAFSDTKIIGFSQNNILLSPACASFDQWKSFEERGDYFCKLFDELQRQISE